LNPLVIRKDILFFCITVGLVVDSETEIYKSNVYCVFVLYQS
jgi:hypothetical protein